MSEPQIGRIEYSPDFNADRHKAIDAQIEEIMSGWDGVWAMIPAEFKTLGEYKWVSVAKYIRHLQGIEESK